MKDAEAQPGTAAPQLVEVRLPSYEQCAEKMKSGPPSALDRFIYDNEPAGRGDDEWRASLVDVLEEAINEDRWARLGGINVKP